MIPGIAEPVVLLGSAKLMLLLGTTEPMVQTFNPQRGGVHRNSASPVMALSGFAENALVVVFRTGRMLSLFSRPMDWKR